MRIYAKISNEKWQNWMDPQLFTREKCVYTQKYRMKNEGKFWKSLNVKSII